MRCGFLLVAVTIAIVCGCTGPAPQGTELDTRHALAVPEYQKALRMEAALDTQLRPTDELLNRIETRLMANPCIGALDRWARRYSYGLDHDRGGLDTDTVWFSMHEAGAYEFRSGRAVLSPREFGSTVDDRPYRFAAGRFDVHLNQVTVEHCGPNLPQ